MSGIAKLVARQKIIERQWMRMIRPGLYPAPKFLKVAMWETGLRNLVLLRHHERRTGFVVVGRDHTASMVDFRRNALTGTNRRIDKHIVWCDLFEDAIAMTMRFT